MMGGMEAEIATFFGRRSVDECRVFYKVMATLFTLPIENYDKMFGALLIFFNRHSGFCSLEPCSHLRIMKSLTFESLHIVHIG